MSGRRQVFSDVTRKRALKFLFRGSFHPLESTMRTSRLPSLVVLLLTVAFSQAEQPEKGKEPPPPIKVKAADLASAYRTNEAFADENYTGNDVEVSGTVHRVRRSPYGEPNKESGYVVVMPSAPNGDPADMPLLLFFDARHRKQLAALRPGQAITVRGRCLGLRVWSGEPKGKKDYTEVWVTACTLLEAAPEAGKK
jgi:hypothetical protein